MVENKNALRYQKYAEIRDKRKMTDAQVAKKTGVAQSTLSDWKRGTSTPAFGNIIKIAECLRVSANRFEVEEEA